jgi:uncharacterized membrane protein YjjP (DUF1212 family)
MSTETSAWLVVGVAGTFCGVIAGLQQPVTPAAVIAIFAVVAVAAIIVSRILPRHADPW